MKPSTLLSPADVLELAPDVTFDGHAISDPLRRSSMPLNQAGAAMISLLPCTVQQLADALVDRYGLDEDRARSDALGFATDMNAGLVANVRMEGTPALVRVARTCSTALMCLASGVRPGGVRFPYARRPLRSTSRARLAAQVARGMVKPGLRCAVASVVPLAAMMLALGVVVAPVLVAVGVAFLLGPGLHEAGHAVALRGVPTALVTTGVGAFIAEGTADARTARRAALSGPLLCVAVAAIALAVGAAASEPFLAVTGLILSLQALSLSVLTADGRNGLSGLPR